MSRPDERDDLVERDAAAQGLRRAMANFATGVTVITCHRDGVHHAMTCNSFTSISLNPPLVMVSASQKGRFHQQFLASDTWAVSVLATGHGDVARHFADPGRDRLRQFAAVPHRISGHTGAALVEGALAWLECRTVEVLPAGDHTIVLGEVMGAEVNEQDGATPLTYFRGGFLDLGIPDRTVP
ncbi:MAG TPA: flavin reductase [Propionibacterium sp.]|jgi:flavin reductase (DIM6/NTAB) family NADH-FMN oxidoreductase RutF|nr:flavin reductase [Propionibacterium sp.]